MSDDTLHFLMVSPASERAEWDRMWDALKRAFKAPDFAEYNAGFGESWQYMGTSLRSDQWEHCFRHRAHPTTGKREYFTVPASDDYHRAHPVPPAPRVPPVNRCVIRRFDPIHCGGAYDGVSVISDADPGL